MNTIGKLYNHTTLKSFILYRFAHLHGFIGLVCGYLVAVKQAHPDSVAFPPPAPPTLRVMVRNMYYTLVS